ncbi:MAG: hypothetical protein ACP5E2_13485 [Terracidiphilus sp.]
MTIPSQICDSTFHAFSFTLRIPYAPRILSCMQDDDLKDLYPALTDEELRIAVENLDRYLELAWEIIEDAQANFDGNAYEL